MDEQFILDKIAQIGGSLPKFDDGRIDYTNATIAPVIGVFVRYNGNILLLKRSDDVGNYKGKWNYISGYLDRVEPLAKKALEEVNEETGITTTYISKVIEGEPYEIADGKFKTTWLVCPFIVDLNKQPVIKLDFEHTDYKWIKPEEINNFDIIPNLDKSYEKCIASNRN
jgi:8-oxo-dGTP diphosphatase